MTTSGTATYNRTRGSLIRSALIDVGLIGASDTSTVDPNLMSEASARLDDLIKSMDSRGAKLWQIVRQTFSTISGQQAYVLPTNVWDVDKIARYTPVGQTTAIMVYPMSRSQWMMTSDRSVGGTPVQYYLEKQLNASGLQFVTMYFYPVPQNTGDPIEYPAILKCEDSGTDANTPYFSQKWLRCLRFGLAAELAPMARLSPGEVQGLQTQFDGEFTVQINADVEIADLQEMPTGGYWLGSGNGGKW